MFKSIATFTSMIIVLTFICGNFAKAGMYENYSNNVYKHSNDTSISNYNIVAGIGDLFLGFFLGYWLIHEVDDTVNDTNKD